MKNTNNEPPAGRIKVKLDSRTIITLSSEAALEFWRTKYPDLKVLQAAS
jgi:hypothetical protein